MRVVLRITSAMIFFGLTGAAQLSRSPSVLAQCSASVTGSAAGATIELTGGEACGYPKPSGTQGDQPSNTEWIDCGAKVSLETVAGGMAGPCQQVAVECDTNGQNPGGKPTTNLGDFVVHPDGSRALIAPACNVPVGAAPAGVSAAAVWQEIRRRVPHPAVGVAPASGRSLVQIQTLFWVNTPTQVDLGTVRLAGQLVRLRVTLRQVTWDFGDGHTDSTDDPGKAYTHDDPCDTKMCPDYYGHVYHRHGTYPVSAQVSWTGQFQLAGAPWRQIPAPVTGPPRTTTVHIYQAHGELVPDPDPTDLHPAH